MYNANNDNKMINCLLLNKLLITHCSKELFSRV